MTFDNLGALNRPYIDGTFDKAIGIDRPLDSEPQRSFRHYITPARIIDCQNPAICLINRSERTAIAIANAHGCWQSFIYRNTAGDTDANFRWSATGGALGRADFPGLYGDVTSDVITYSNQYSSVSGAMNAGGFYYITLPHELGHALGLASAPQWGWNNWNSSLITETLVANS